MRVLFTILVLVGLFVVGCTTTDEVIVDTKGVDLAVYEQDLAECRGYAAQVKTSEKTTRGAATGAVVGGLLGGITNGSEGAARGAGVGVVGGGVRGAKEGERDEVQVAKRCMRGRGYKVLN